MQATWATPTTKPQNTVKQSQFLDFWFEQVNSFFFLTLLKNVHFISLFLWVAVKYSGCWFLLIPLTKEGFKILLSLNRLFVVLARLLRFHMKGLGNIIGVIMVQLGSVLELEIVVNKFSFLSM